jgi:hypothetical protein
MQLLRSIFLVLFLASVCIAQSELCPNMQTGGDTWYCCPCGGEYTCTWNGLADDACWVPTGVNPGYCELPSLSSDWLCCRDCSVQCPSVCQYNAPNPIPTYPTPNSASVAAPAALITAVVGAAAVLF